MNRCNKCKFAYQNTEEKYRGCKLDDKVVNAYGCEKDLKENQ